MTIYKVIAGKRYDTRTAQLQAEFKGYDIDYQWKHEELYRKKTGEYFLASEGRFSAKIEPFSEADAKKWVEQYCPGEEYHRIFGVNSFEDTARITISLPDSLAKKLGIIAQNESISISGLCRLSIEKYISHYEEDIEKYVDEVFQPVDEVSNHD